MTWFNNQMIRTKLILSFVFLSLIGVFIGAVGIINIRALDKSDDEMYNNLTVPIAYMSEISTYFQRIRFNTIEIIIAESPAESGKYFTKIDAYQDSITAYEKKFEERILSDQMKVEWNNFKESRVAFANDLEKLRSFATVKNDIDAKALIKGSMNTTSRAEMGEIAKIVQMKTKDAETKSDINTREANSATILMVIAIVIGILISFGLGFIIAKKISEPIKQVVERMSSLSNICITNLAKGCDQLANGDLNIKIVTGTNHLVIRSQDELGQLAQNMNKIITDTQGTVISIEKAVEAVKNTVAETRMLVDAAVNGKLKTRGDVSRFNGSYKELIVGLNATFDAIVKPINESSQVLEAMAAGDLTGRIKEEYSGDYKLLKDSINKFGESMCEALTHVSAAVEATASASNEISSSTEQMAAGAQEQSA